MTTPPITPTALAYYIVCRRKTWLFANNIQMEQSSDTVYEGKMISETTYPDRARKYTELDLGHAKIDFYDANNKVVHEVKKSNKMEHAHTWQVKYYLYLLRQEGIEGATGLLEYPKLKKTETITLEEDDMQKIETMLQEIRQLIQQETCPPVIDKPVCKRCSYYDFCYG